MRRFEADTVMRAMIGGAMLVMASAASAQQPPSVQQAFTAAAALDGTGTPEQRLGAWSALETRVANNKRSRAVVRIRKAQALIALDRKDEAVATLQAGLADLPAGDATLADDRMTAQLRLGQIAAGSLDYAGAIRWLGEADRTAGVPADRLAVLYALAHAQIFVDPAAATATLARAQALLAQTAPDKDVQAMFRRLEAERLLNAGDFEGARAKAGEAVTLLGGLTERTSLSDVQARSDYAIAALLGGHAEEARRYMAMTGAGRASEARFDPGAMRVPDCGGDLALKPSDLAVIEFSVGADGQVIDSQPVYAAGGGEVALTFARAAREWSWTPQQLKALPAFYRSRVRVEMRCSTGFERPSMDDYLVGALGKWLTAQGVEMPPPPEGADREIVGALRTAQAAAAARDPQGLATIPPAVQLIRNAAVPRDETHALALQAQAILAAHRAPPLARLFVDQMVWGTAGSEWKRRDAARALAAAQAQPDFAADPEARTALRMMAAMIERGSPTKARPYLVAVAADVAVPRESPLRAAALVQLASLEVGAGNAEAARAAFLQSGLDPTQCALIDTPPRFLGAGGTFPQEALRWGFEGWTRVQHDIDASGRVLHERVVLAYPPFVFSKAGSAAVAGARYAKSYRPDGGLGCGGSVQSVVFHLPR